MQQIAKMESQEQQRDSSEERAFQRRESRRLRARERRLNESDEERIRRTNANRESMRRRRQQETQEETLLRTEQNRESMRLRLRRGTVLKVALTNAIPESLSIGTCTTVCEFCRARYFETEKPRQNLTPCCGSGKINLPLRREPPELLTALFTNIHPKSQEFLKNIRT